MNNLNSVLLEGRLVQDPKITHFSETNSSLCKLSIANNRYYKKDGKAVHEVSYFNVDVWGNTGANCAKYLHKGNGVRVVGRLKQDRWKDDKEASHQAIKVVAEHVDFFPNRNNAKSTKKSDNEVTEASPLTDITDDMETEVINL